MLRYLYHALESFQRVYHRLLRFFRSTAYGYGELLDAWQRYVLSQEVTVEVEGRSVLLGDHTHVVKDGGRMPIVLGAALRCFSASGNPAAGWKPCSAHAISLGECDWPPISCPTNRLEICIMGRAKITLVNIENPRSLVASKAGSL
jgi:hypothetical protein